ncbi:MAG: SMC-Scp complex subunit ScpB [Coriobacteriales bacterium]|jgi:segregation and condensation protein B|nr:SMC-Scp complex subunit ScpB [Coriobacteriales bacterium]
MPDTDDNSLSGALEALLFVSDEPVKVSKLADILEADTEDVKAALVGLAEQLEHDERGIQLRDVAGGWKLYTHPAYHELIEKYVISWDTRTLSQAALEALAVIAYHQPATRADVNAIRGVNSEGVIASLVEKGLVREAGRDSRAGNAILYATTRTFLEKFGLRTLSDLPPLEDFAPDEESKAYIRERLSARAPSSDELDFGDDAEREDDADDMRGIDGAETGGDAANDAEGVDYGDEYTNAQGLDEIIGESVTEKIEIVD